MACTFICNVFLAAVWVCGIARTNAVIDNSLKTRIVSFPVSTKSSSLGFRDLLKCCRDDSDNWDFVAIRIKSSDRTCERLDFSWLTNRTKEPGYEYAVRLLNRRILFEPIVATQEDTYNYELPGKFEIGATMTFKIEILSNYTSVVISVVNMLNIVTADYRTFQNDEVIILHMKQYGNGSGIVIDQFINGAFGAHRSEYSALMKVGVNITVSFTARTDGIDILIDGELLCKSPHFNLQETARDVEFRGEMRILETSFYGVKVDDDDDIAGTAGPTTTVTTSTVG